MTLATFKAMLETDDYLVLDTETTGLHDGEICQIAIVESSGEVALNTLVKTSRSIPPDATRIHGITDEMVVDGLPWSAFVPMITELLSGRNLVVYNAIYDRKMMHQSAEKEGIAKTEWKEVATWWCAMEAYAEFHGDWNDYYKSYRWQSLSNACYQMGIPVNNAHSALGDCLMTLHLSKKMIDPTYIPVKAR